MHPSAGNKPSSKAEIGAALTAMRQAGTNHGSTNQPMAHEPLTQPDSHHPKAEPSSSAQSANDEVGVAGSLIMEEQMKSEPPTAQELEEYARWLGLDPNVRFDPHTR